ncbi:hypothetical protein DEU56DRAFT_760355 [Suillus clintonianus]|uniref:uncharacterized protein n=1 Tax=Suillus clintonianus TaxID=1904413 RepID=UPI001B88360C|nr:uncharacterized protein DEU56DRAFT_760355 [Suillus clintonianus]KAG2122504.1 hypothetical protein DEU56DRAFT_760355 [Suillus clintonianus]
MLESTFSEQRQQTSEESSQKSKMNKRWKTDLHSSLSTSTGDDADDDSYYMSLPVVKKSKGGVGYARDVKEDEQFVLFLGHVLLRFIDVLRPQYSGAVAVLSYSLDMFLRFIDVLRPQYSGGGCLILASKQGTARSAFGFFSAMRNDLREPIYHRPGGDGNEDMPKELRRRLAKVGWLNEKRLCTEREVHETSDYMVHPHDEARKKAYVDWATQVRFASEIKLKI